MAYGMPIGYPMYQQQPYQQPQDQLAQLRGMQYQQPVMQQQAIQQGPIWVQGEAGAKSYIVAPNTTVILLDIDNPGIMYIKSTNQAGIPSMQAYEYRETGKNPQAVPNGDEMRNRFVSREEYNATISDLTARLNALAAGAAGQATEGGIAHE